MKKLENKNAIVTAGSKGIGLGIATLFRKAGANVFICSRSKENVDAAVDTLGRFEGARIGGIPGDIGSADFLKELVQKSGAFFGGHADILVNNSGGPPGGDTFHFQDKDWDGALQRNLLSVIRLCQAVVPEMKKKKWGRIINITSTTAKEPDSGMVLSNVTRAAVSSYAKTISREVGPFGITVNTILTGACLTDRLLGPLQAEARAGGKSVEAALAEIYALVPVGFIPEPEEFASLILFLASEESRFITGTSINVDGGLTRSLF